MRNLSFSAVAVVIVLFSSPVWAVRFTGTGTLGESSINVTNFGSIAFIPTWTVDFDTDGQSMTLNQFDVSFNGTLQFFEHSQVELDLVVSGSLTGSSLDLNPTPGFELWSVEPFVFPDLQVSGEYRSFGFSNSFNATVPAPTSSFQRIAANLQLSDFPTTASFGRTSRDTTSYGSLGIELEPLFFLNSLDLSINGFLQTIATPASAGCPCCECGDFDGDTDTDGSDFLNWQKGNGILSGALLSDGDANGDGMVDSWDLAEWQVLYGNAESPVALAVPEPAGLGFVIAVLCSATILKRK